METRAGLAWQENGDPQGRPALFCHGWPSSRLLGNAWETTARRRGWRVITPDRPGIGRSPAAAPSFAAWPERVGALLDTLGIGSCPVIGMSGGGPYALACVARAPERFPRAVVLSGAPPLHEQADHARIMPAFRWLAWWQHARPQWVRWGFRIARTGVRGLDVPTARRLALATTRPPDSALFAEARSDSTLSSGLEAWRGAPDGVCDEGRLYLEPWDFEVEAIRVPVAFWHGAHDPLFHWSLAERLARRLSGAVFHRLEHGGHFTPLYEAQEAVFDWLEREANFSGAG